MISISSVGVEGEEVGEGEGEGEGEGSSWIAEALITSPLERVTRHV